jgi:hypothetical protein
MSRREYSPLEPELAFERAMRRAYHVCCPACLARLHPATMACEESQRACAACGYRRRIEP